MRGYYSHPLDVKMVSMRSNVEMSPSFVVVSVEFSVVTLSMLGILARNVAIANIIGCGLCGEKCAWGYGWIYNVWEAYD